MSKPVIIKLAKTIFKSLYTKWNNGGNGSTLHERMWEKKKKEQQEWRKHSKWENNKLEKTVITKDIVRNQRQN